MYLLSFSRTPGSSPKRKNSIVVDPMSCAMPQPSSYTSLHIDDERALALVVARGKVVLFLQARLLPFPIEVGEIIEVERDAAAAGAVDDAGNRLLVRMLELGAARAEEKTRAVDQAHEFFVGVVL